ncbi:MAG TPA: twin-arginine translocation signal domain-containing protein [Dongiaceae bacterium]|nr:twin-arginine translocation signal domain-containing protein [Dongiaceae bacterium]
MNHPDKQHLSSDQIAQQLGPYSRRRFLKGSVAVAMATSTVLTLGCGSPDPVQPDLKALSPTQQQLFARLTSVLLPTAGTTLFPVEQTPVLRNLDHLFEGLDEKVRGDLGGAIGLFEYGSLVLGGYFSRFSKLSDTDAVAYIESWQNGNSIQRGIITTLKKLVYASYWREESTWVAVDYDGPVSERWGIPSLGNAPLPAE